MKRRFTMAVGCLVFAGVVIPAATADPSNAKNAGQVNAICSGPITVVVNGNGEFTPAHVVGSTSVFIPTAFDLKFTFTPAGGGTPMSDTDMSAKAAPIKNTVTCTIPPQTLFSGPEGTQTIEGTVTGFFTPR